MEKLVILDYSTGEVDIYPMCYAPNPGTSVEELLASIGHDANNCEWMFTVGNITFHKEVLK